MAEGKDFLSCRSILWTLIFSGCAVNYMLKFSLNLVIVAMVKPKKTRESVAQCVALQNSTVWTNATITPQPLNVNSTTAQPDEPDYSDKFDWSEYEQGLVIGALFWLYWSSQVPGGILGQRYGAKRVFGGGNFFGAIINLCLPFAIKYHLMGAVVLRVLLGLIMGTMYPALHGLPGKWAPPNERSKFLVANMGGSIGTAITYPFCAIIISYFNWESAIYATSCVAFIWCTLWSYFAYDSPQEHPRISRKELEYIEKNIPADSKTKNREVPWRAILTSMPLWVTIVAQFGMTWGFYTVLTQSPSYFNYIHGWDINMTGLLSGIPHLVLFGFAYMYAAFSDWLLSKKNMSRTTVRKMAVMVGSGGQAAMLIGLSLSGCKPTWAIVFMILGTALNGTMSTGTISNFVDLSPNYANIAFGIAGLIANAAGFLSPMIVGILTNNNQTIEQWRMVFLIAAGILLVGFVTFVIWGTSKEQEWNNHGASDTEHGEELQKLKPQPDLHTVDETMSEKLPKSENIMNE